MSFISQILGLDFLPKGPSKGKVCTSEYAIVSTSNLLVSLLVRILQRKDELMNRPEEVEVCREVVRVHDLPVKHPGGALGGNSIGFVWPEKQPHYQPENQPEVPKGYMHRIPILDVFGRFSSHF